MPDPTPDGFALQSQSSNHNAESAPSDTVGRVARSTDGDQAAVATTRKRARSETEAEETLTPNALARAAVASNQEPAVVTPPSPLPDAVGRAAHSTDEEQAVGAISRKRHRSETEARQALTPDVLARAAHSSNQDIAAVAAPLPLPATVGCAAQSTDGEQAVVTTSRKRRHSETEAGETTTPDALARATPSSNQEPAVITAPRKRRRRAGAHLAPSRLSRRIAGEKSSVEFSGGSIRDGARTPSVSQGKYNPGSESSRLNLQRDQARWAQRRDEAKGIYTGPVATPKEGKFIVVAEFSGGWKKGKRISPRNKCKLAYTHAQTKCELHSSKYDGTWEPGTPHGEGRIKYVSVAQHRFLDNDFTYSGGFHEGCFHGSGTLSFPNGDVISGSFYHHALEHGKGTKTHADGSRYHGPFVNFPDKSLKLEPVAQGIGTLDYEDEEGKKGRYEGSWYEGKRSGEGTERYPDGSEYTGMFQNGVAHGKGTYSCARRKVCYEGEHLYGVAYGRGTSKYPNGFEVTGSFMEDRPHISPCSGAIKDCKGNVFYGSTIRGRLRGTGVLMFKKEDGHKCQANYSAVFDYGAIVINRGPCVLYEQTFWDTKGVKWDVCWACRCHTVEDSFGHYRQVLQTFQEFLNSKVFSEALSNRNMLE